MGRGMLVVGAVFHACYILSIFDIYFRSPIVNDVPSISLLSSPLPPAARVVVFVADGCRADKLFEANASHADMAEEKLREANLLKELSRRKSIISSKEETRVPFLRNIIKNHGSWGVSHTRVPTESRP